MRVWDEYRKEYKVRGGVEMTGKGEPWHTKEKKKNATKLDFITATSMQKLHFFIYAILCVNIVPFCSFRMNM